MNHCTQGPWASLFPLWSPNSSMWQESCRGPLSSDGQGLTLVSGGLGWVSMVRGAGCGLQVPMGWVQGTAAVQPPGAICGGTSQWDNRGDTKSRVPRQVLGEGVFLGEQANLEFLDLIRKQLGCVQGGVAWGRTEPLGHGPALQKKAWRGAGESDLAKTQNSMRQPLRGPEPKCQLPPCSEAMHVSGDPHTSYFRRQSRPHLYSKNPANGSSSEGLCAGSNQGPISSPLPGWPPLLHTMSKPPWRTGL